MGDVLIGLILGLVLAVVLAIGWRRLRRGRAKGPRITVQTSLEKFRSIGELSVYRLVAKEIVTAQDHWVGDFGEKYLSWLVTPKRLAMIFEFDVDFRYNLASPEMAVSEELAGEYAVRLPPCSYEVRIIDMRMHSEKGTELLPWLMPDLVNRFFTGGFSVDQKNALIDEAKTQAVTLAKDLVAAAEGDAQRSARRSIEMLAAGFGAGRVSVGFAPTTEFRPRIDATRIEGLLEARPEDE